MLILNLEVKKQILILIYVFSRYFVAGKYIFNYKRTNCSSNRNNRNHHNYHRCRNDSLNSNNSLNDANSNLINLSNNNLSNNLVTSSGNTSNNNNNLIKNSYHSRLVNIFNNSNSSNSSSLGNTSGNSLIISSNDLYRIHSNDIKCFKINPRNLKVFLDFCGDSCCINMREQHYERIKKAKEYFENKNFLKIQNVSKYIEDSEPSCEEYLNDYSDVELSDEYLK